MAYRWIEGETMDFIRALQSVEEILYEMSMWIILVPKTFLRVVFTPQWIQKYVAGEWAKNDASQQEGESDAGNGPPRRFDSYMSPLFFFLIVGVIPLYLVIVSQNSQTSSSDLFTWALQQPVETRLTVYGILLLTGPLGFSLGIQLLRRIPFARQSVQRIFYTQCYCFAPLYFLLNLAQAFYNLSVSSLVAARWIFLFPFVWFLPAEMFVFAQELTISRLKALGFAFLCLIETVILYVFFFFILTVMVGLITGNVRQWLPFLH